MPERTQQAPLDDAAYVPTWQPVNGAPPDLIAKWGPRSQMRWFRRFRGSIKPMPGVEWARFYCSSVQHRGQCCWSCMDDLDGGWCDWDLPQDYLNPTVDERCCCYAINEGED